MCKNTCTHKVQSLISITFDLLQDYFTIEKNTGCVTVANKLDRETAETIVFDAMVNDGLAITGPGTKPQTAKGNDDSFYL